MSRPHPQPCKALNWPESDKALKRRGSLTIWFDPDMAWSAKPTGKRGRQPVDSDASVQTWLTMEVLFGMALAPMVPELLSQIRPDQKSASVTADGACDARKCHDAIAESGAHAVIPPHNNAKP
jgi:hypothetical protein